MYTAKEGSLKFNALSLFLKKLEREENKPKEEGKDILVSLVREKPCEGHECLGISAAQPHAHCARRG